MKHIACRVFVRGLVQGVGFRGQLQSQAGARQVTGWTRNTDDGRLEAFVEGLPASVQGLVAWMHRGPEAAEVLGVEVLEAQPIGGTAFVREPQDGGIELSA